MLRGSTSHLRQDQEQAIALSRSTVLQPNKLQTATVEELRMALHASMQQLQIVQVTYSVFWGPLFLIAMLHGPEIVNKHLHQRQSFNIRESLDEKTEISPVCGGMLFSGSAEAEKPFFSCAG